MDKLISVVIINKNDRGIADTLQALQKVRSPLPFEVVVIDASEGRLNDIAAAFPDVRWVAFASRTGRRFTIPEQRNTGVAEARGEIVAFTDANCVPNDDWLERLVAPILEEGEQLVAGSTVSRGDSSIYDQDHDHRAGQKYIRECPTINVAFRKTAYQKIGGFDERFDYGSDVDFSWRANDLGLKVRYIPEAIVAHDWGGASDNAKRSYRYGVARARLYKKHPHRWRQLFTNDITALIYPLYILGLPLTIWFWPYPLLILVPLAKNITKSPLNVLKKHLIYGAGVLRELIRV
ncbi:MAG TPA: glycosyltransferase [Candidatus Saccharimonadales bacterium]